MKTGESFTAVLENRRKSGELFLNLLDLCGLTVARDQTTGDELWFLVGIQADVSALSRDAMEKAATEIHSVANDIHLQLADQLSALAISGALKFTVSTASGHLRNKEPLEELALLKGHMKTKEHHSILCNIQIHDTNSIFQAEA